MRQITDLSDKDGIKWYMDFTGVIASRQFVLGYLTQVILEYNFAFSLGYFSSETQTDLLSRTYPRIYMDFLQEPPYVREAKLRFLAYVSFNQPIDSGHPFAFCRKYFRLFHELSHHVLFAKTQFLLLKKPMFLLTTKAQTSPSCLGSGCLLKAVGKGCRFTKSSALKTGVRWTHGGEHESS